MEAGYYRLPFEWQRNSRGGRKSGVGLGAGTAANDLNGNLALSGGNWWYELKTFPAGSPFAY